MKKNTTSLQFIAVFTKTVLFTFLFSILFVGSSWGQTTVTYSTAGTYNWTVPTGVTSIQVEAWGGGGGGGGATAATGRSGGGGAGGAYVKNTNVTVIAGTTYTITVGAGGVAGTSSSATVNGAAGGSSTAVFGSTTITAVGGGGANGGASGAVSGAGGTGTNSGNAGFSGSFNYAGGNGASGLGGSYGGGGGGSAGSSGIGANASTSVAGGIGATGAALGFPGTVGGSPGGGGSGGATSAATGKAGGAGGAGQIIITYTPTTPTISTSSMVLTGFFQNLNSTTSNSWDPSTTQSITVNGTNMTSGITIAPPANYDISIDNGTTWISSPNTITTNSAASISVTLLARLNSSSSAYNNPYTGNISITGTGSNTVSISLSGNRYYNYFYKGTGSLNTLTNWTSNINGTGSNPSSLTSVDYVNYYINSNCTTTDAEFIFSSTTGVRSYLYIGNPALPGIKFEVMHGQLISSATGTPCSSCINISPASSGSNTLLIRNSAFLTSALNTLDPNSYLEYNSELGTGISKTIYMTSQGSGYSATPVVTLNGGDGTIGTYTAAVTVGTGSSAGKITAITLTMSNFTGFKNTPPIVTITDATGTGATAIANILYSSKTTIASKFKVSGGYATYDGTSLNNDVEITTGQLNYAVSSGTISGSVKISNTGNFKLVNSNASGRSMTIKGDLLISGTGGFGNIGSSQRFDLNLSGTSNFLSNTSTGSDFAKTNINFISGSNYTLSDKFDFSSTVPRIISIISGATLDLANKNLNLRQNYLANNGTLNNSNNITIENYLGNKRGWNLMGNPFDNSLSINDIANNSTTPIDITFSTNKTALKSSITQYNSDTDKWVDTLNSTIFIPSNSSFALFNRGIKGEGLYGNYNAATPSKTTISLTGTYTQKIPTSITTKAGKYYVYTNPYAYPISVFKLINASSGLSSTIGGYSPSLVNNNNTLTIKEGGIVTSTADITAINDFTLLPLQAIILKANSDGSIVTPDFATLTTTNTSSATYSASSFSADPGLDPDYCYLTTGLIPNLADINVPGSINANKNTITLNNSTPGGFWNSRDTTIAKVDINTGLLKGLAQGNVIIDYILNPSNGCNNATSKTIQIGSPETPLISATGNTSFCDGQSVVLKSDETTGIQWYLDNVLIAGATNSSYVAKKQGIYTVTKTSNNTQLQSSGLSIQVYDLPPVPTIGDLSYCNFASTSKLFATPTNIANTIKWYADATSTVVLADAPTPNSAAAGVYSFYATQTVPVGCESPKAKLNVTINALPSAPVVADVNYCINFATKPLTATFLGKTYTANWYNVATGGTTTALPTPTSNTLGTVKYYVSQTYTITGCESPRALINVNTYSIPAPTIISKTPDQKLNTSSGTIFQWYKDNIIINGATSASYAPIEKGKYSAIIAINGCYSTMSDTYEFINMSEKQDGYTINVGPNPFTNYIQLNYSIPAVKTVTISLFSLATSTKVFEAKDVLPNAQVPINNLLPGIYMIQITSDDARIVEKYKMIKL